jgi:hypothetical protein
MERLSTRILTAAFFLGLLLAPSTARADNMSGLIFVVVIWPVGLLCGLLLMVLGAVAKWRLRSRTVSPTSTFPHTLMVISIIVGLGFPLLTLILSFDADPDAEILVMTILPVEVLAVWCVVMGRRLARQAVKLSLE